MQCIDYQAAHEHDDLQALTLKPSMWRWLSGSHSIAAAAVAAANREHIIPNRAGAYSEALHVAVVERHAPVVQQERELQVGGR
jgi:hypothetical protein